MPYYKLVSQNRPDAYVDEIVFTGENDSRQTVNVDTPTELSEADAQAARDLGYEIVQVDEPAKGDVPSQPVGGDVAGMSPVIGHAAGEPVVSQAGMQAAVDQSSQSPYGSEDDNETNDNS